MSQIKAIFVDFDWTIFDHKHNQIPQSTIHALNKAKENHLLLFLVSARTYYSLEGMKILDLVDFDGFGVINGGMSFNKEKDFHTHYLINKDIADIIDVCEKNHLSYLVSTKYKTYLKEVGHDPLVKEFYKAFREPSPLDYQDYNQKDKLLAIQVFYEEDKDYLFEKFISRVSMNRFFSCVVEFNERSFYKNEAVQEIQKAYHLKKEECLALGDDLNDIEMFHQVGTSVCLGNGNEEAKKEATFVTRNIEDDGLEFALKHFKII